MKGSLVKVGICRVCGGNWEFDATYEHYATVTNPFTYCCNDCLEHPSNRCKGCNASGDQLLLCDQCDTQGTSCLGCATGIVAKPVKGWQTNANAPIGFSPSCTIVDSDAKKVHDQYHVHCKSCDVDACMSCATICHHGHELNRLAYGPLRCECGRGEHCNDSVLRKATRIDNMITLRARTMHVHQQWTEADQTEKRLQRDMEAFEQQLEGQQQVIGEYEQVLCVSTVHESELRAALCDGTKEATELCEIVANIVDETRVRNHAVETARRAEQERVLLSARLAQAKEEAQQFKGKVVALQAERVALRENAASLLDFEGL
jgi:hypothetical protein